MKIVVDQNMPFGAEAFSTLGDVALRDGRAITAADVRDAELLICRSTTKVNAALLDGSHVRFVGSGVIGTDHLDIPYLAARGIKWVNAPGCNARSVANYVATALMVLGVSPAARPTVGIVGVGHVGTRVKEFVEAMGFRTLLNDPPKRLGVPLADLLARSDIVTLHTPLTRDGAWPTFHLLGAEEFGLMKPGVVFFNCARGPVIDSGAFVAAKKAGHISKAVIDCWEGEPKVRADVMACADIATPHIAGHSFEGKVNGTAAVYRAACAFLGVAPTFDFVLPPVPAGFRYDILADDRAFRADPAKFDWLRGHYPPSRRELPTAAFR